MAARCFQVRSCDNVGTLLDDAQPGAVEVIGGLGGRVGTAAAQLVATEPISLGHKVALADIPSGGEVVKFGVTIGRATQDISAGSWVHLHNCASEHDARSQTLDKHTGATTDTVYE